MPRYARSPPKIAPRVKRSRHRKSRTRKVKKVLKRSAKKNVNKCINS